MAYSHLQGNADRPTRYPIPYGAQNTLCHQCTDASQFLQSSSFPLGPGGPQCSLWLPATGHHDSVQILGGASSVGRKEVTTREGLYLCHS